MTFSRFIYNNKELYVCFVARVTYDSEGEVIHRLNPFVFLRFCVSAIWHLT